MKGSILIVDDDFDDLRKMKIALEKRGYGVSVATNGAQALDLTAANSFSLILIDIRMPVLSGYDLVRLLRTRVGGRTKVAYVSVVPEGRVSMENTDGFIQKPFTEAAFCAGVKRIISK